MTDWESHYASGNTPWDKGGSHPALEEIFQKVQLSGRIAVPGCGVGYDAAILSHRCSGSVVGIDISPTAVATAAERWAKLPNLEFTNADLFCLPPEWSGSFDAAFEHTCYCAIDPSMRESYVRVLASLLRPGGVLAGIFYLRPWEEGEDQTQGPPFGASISSLDATFLPFFDLETEWVPESTFPGREGRELVRILRKK